MKNKEKYAKEIIEIACDGNNIAIASNSGKLVRCKSIKCYGCLFDFANCEKETREWAESEYIEKPVISKRDRAFLEYIKEGCKFIARDENGKLFVYGSKPYKDKRCNCWRSDRRNNPILCLNYNIVFPMVKWEDSEPWLIEDLKQFGVVDEYE